MVRIATTCALALLLAGCATDLERASTNMAAGLDELVGQPVGEAFALLGDPVGQTQLDEYTVYGWGHSEIETVSRANFNRQLYSQNFSVGSTIRRDIAMHCELRLMVTPDGTVDGWHFMGNLGGCRPYAERLEAVARL